MAFKSQDLSVIAYANGFTMWHYSSIDITSAIDNAGYFNEAASMLRIGDVIFINSDMDNVTATGIATVNQNQNDTVDVANITALSAIKNI